MSEKAGQPVRIGMHHHHEREKSEIELQKGCANLFALSSTPSPSPRQLGSMEAPRINLGPTTGMLEIGTILTMFLTGIGTTQAWNYFRDHSGGPPGMSILVGALYLADCFHSAMLVHAVYQYTIVFFSEPEALELVVWSVKVSSPFVSGIVLAVQTYFCFRVYSLTRIKALAVGCWTLALTRGILGVAQAVTIARSATFAVIASDTFRWQATAILSIGAASDVLIAGSICWGLLRFRSGAFASTAKLVDKLVAFTIGSGLLTSIVAGIEAITYWTLPNFFWLLLFSIMPKLFTISLMVSLNEQKHNKRIMTGGSTCDLDTGVSFNVTPARGVQLAKMRQDETDLTSTTASYMFQKRSEQYE